MNKEKITLVLPMAGHGSRFNGLDYNLPKPLLPVGGNPMVLEAIRCLPKTDFKIFICLKDHIDRFGIDKILQKDHPNSFISIVDSVTEGQACTCEIGLKSSCINPNDSILISACDNGVIFNKEAYEFIVSDLKNDIIVWTFKNNSSSYHNPNMYSWIVKDNDGLVKKVHTKKFPFEDVLDNEAIIGTMFFRKSQYFIENFKKMYEDGTKTNGEFYVDDVINKCLDSGLVVRSFCVDGYICWGTPNDYELNTKK